MATLFKCTQKANSKLEQSPEGRLVKVKRGNHDTFFQVYSADGGRVRKAITKNQEKINALARKSFLESKIKLLEKDIKALSYFCMSYVEPTYDNIVSKMPQRMLGYGLVENDFNDWGNQPYNQSKYLPEKKIHTTSKGLKMRSKSELLIAEKLYEYNIPFRYEQILDIDGIQFAPDFTIMTVTKGLMYWEHCGLTNNNKYMENHKRKLLVYENKGIVPWKNLIVTYDDEFGNIDMCIVESEIKNRVLR